MRLLHARHADDADRVPARQSGPDRTGGTDRDFRHSVSLYWLSEHRHRGPRRGETAAGRRTANGEWRITGCSFRAARHSPFAALDVMAIRFDDIGNRLKAFRLGSGLSADEVARSIGISRTALYRFEKGELAKIETIERLAELLEVSIPTLLGVGIEYIASAVAYFERMRQIEETAEHIIVLAGPISFLLSSDNFQSVLEEMLRESIPADLPNRERALADVSAILDILRQRKETYRKRKPAIVHLRSALEIERLLRNGFTGTKLIPEEEQHRR